MGVMKSLRLKGSSCSSSDRRVRQKPVQIDMFEGVDLRKKVDFQRKKFNYELSRLYVS